MTNQEKQTMRELLQILSDAYDAGDETAIRAALAACVAVVG